MQSGRKQSKANPPKERRSKTGRFKINESETRRHIHDYVTDVSHSKNFITDRKLINRIVHLSNIDKNDTVIEIGAGKGHLTEALCRKGGFVYSVEIDRQLYESTREKLSRYSNLNLIYGDFLNYSLPQKGDYKIFANIPYFITTQIVGKTDCSQKGRCRRH